MREVEAALSALRFDEKDRKAVLKATGRIFEKEEPIIAMKAIRIWKDSDGALSFHEALEKAKGEIGEELVGEGVVGVHKCPSCGAPLICPSCGWPKGVRSR